MDPAGGAPDLTGVIRTNTLVLAACMALSWAVIQLVAAVSAVTLTRLTGQPALGGLAPGIYMASWAAASLLAGRFMDVHGRAPGLRLGFVVGLAGAALVYLGVSTMSLPAFLVGLIVLGMCGGTVNLARAGAADMYPPERRARGISYVLLGAAVGAILAPIAFAPLLAGVRTETGGLATPWLVAGAFLAVGVIVTFGIRIDPVTIGRRQRSGAGSAADEPRRHLGTLLRLPRVAPALFAAVAAQAVMSALMSIIGLVMVENGHHLGSVALTMSIHFIGMFGLVLVAGQLVDHLGRQRAIIIGLGILAAGALLLMVGTDLYIVLPAMFAIGLGWDVAFVGSTAVVGDAARPLERAGLLGFNDFVAIALASLGSIGAGVMFGLTGIVPLAVVAAIVVLAPIPFLLATSEPGRTPSAG